MGTTSVDPSKTAGEIVSILSRHGATSINQTYESGRLVGLQWLMARKGAEPALYSMPARVEPVWSLMRRKCRGNVSREQAERTAWRLVLRWVQAQFALIETGMVEPAEVFAPYREVAPGKTVWAALLEAEANRGPLMLESAK